MLGKRRAMWALRLLVADGSVLLGSFVGAYTLRVLLNDALGRDAGPLSYYLWLLGLIVPVWIALLAGLGGYGLGWTTRSRAWLAARVSGIGLLLVTAALFFAQESEVNRSLLLLFSSVSAVGLWVERTLVLAWLRRRRGERWSHVALVVGTDERAERLIASLRRYPEAGWLVRGCLSVDPADAARSVGGVPVIGTLQDLPDLLQEDVVVDEVFFAVPPDRLDRLTDALEACENLGVDARVLVDLYRPAHAHAYVEELFTLPFYGVSPTLTRQGALAVKRAIDVVGALLILVLTLPLLLGRLLAHPDIVARARHLPPGAERLSWSRLSDVQASHDGRRRRGATGRGAASQRDGRSRLQDHPRSAADLGWAGSSAATASTSCPSSSTSSRAR